MGSLHCPGPSQVLLHRADAQLTQLLMQGLGSTEGEPGTSIFGDLAGKNSQSLGRVTVRQFGFRLEAAPRELWGHFCLPMLRPD